MLVIIFDPFSQIIVMDIPAVADVLVDAGGLIPGDQFQEQAVVVDAFAIRLQCLILALCDIVSALSSMEYEYPSTTSTVTGDLEGFFSSWAALPWLMIFLFALAMPTPPS